MSILAVTGYIKVDITTNIKPIQNINYLIQNIFWHGELQLMFSIWCFHKEYRLSWKFWQIKNTKQCFTKIISSGIWKSLSRCCVSCCFNYRFVNSCYWPRAWQEINSTLLRLTFSHFQSVKLSNSRFLIWFVSLIVTFI